VSASAAAERTGFEEASLRVAVVTESSERSASTTYRALQHVPRLAERLGEVDVFMPDDEVARGAGRADQVRFFARHAVRYGRRRAELARVLPGYDAVLVQRAVYPMGPAWAARPLDDFSGRVVLDLDDAVFLTPPVLEGKGRAARWLYAPQQQRRLLERAEALVVSNEAVADSLPGRSADAILPSVPDPSAFEPVEHGDEGPLRTGWVGTEGNLGYLDPLAEVVGRLAGEGVARLEVVSSVAWHGPATFTPWRRDEVAATFARIEVGLMPLPDTPYTRAKAGFKLLQHMAAGAAVVASPVGVNVELVERSGGGLLAREPAEWEEALRGLRADPARRAELGARGRAFVERYADLDAQADTLARLLRG
jgi:hypothetical protein